MAKVLNVNDVLDGHVVLDLECLNRVHLNAYVPTLQVGGQVAAFMTHHLHQTIPSPAIIERIGNRFRKAVTEFAEDHDVPVLRFKKGDRHIDLVRPLAAKAKTPGVVAIGVAQEFQWVFTGHKRPAAFPGRALFSFEKAERRVSCFYFYVWDDDFGLGFIKICSYFPYPAKVWVNGHEWAKCQATKAGVGFTSLANGFASCEDPPALQEICDRLGPGEIEAFFERLMAAIPTPLGPEDRAGGYWWELSMRQVEVSRTLVFDAPRRARGFFEALVADNLGVGRPEEVKVIFGRQIRSTTKGEFSTLVVSRATEVTVNVSYKNSRIKQYLKEGRALRIDTVVNEPNDLGCQRRLRNLDDLQGRARLANRRRLDVQKVGQSCAITTTLLERVSLPTIEEGQRTPALRFGDPLVMALAGALCALVHVVVGFTNRSPCARVSPPLDGLYTSAQMTYDLRRLRLKGLIRRIPRSNRYVLARRWGRSPAIRSAGALTAAPADRRPDPPDHRVSLDGAIVARSGVAEWPSSAWIGVVSRRSRCSSSW